MSDHMSYMERCLVLEERIKKLRAALVMARGIIPPGMKAELQQIDDALRELGVS
jgi:hypothetical protein